LTNGSANTVGGKMGKTIRFCVFVAVLIATLISVKPGYCAWQLTSELETIILTRTDEPLQEIDHGMYVYFDTKTQELIVVLNFNYSPDPIYVPEGYQLQWVPDPQLDKYP
jgi:hypothetical protein